MYEHTCLENIKKFYKYAVKCDDQQRYKAIIEVAMVSTPERFTDNSAISSRKSMTVKNPSARKPIIQFLDTLEFKPNTAVPRFCAGK